MCICTFDTQQTLDVLYKGSGCFTVQQGEMSRKRYVSIQMSQQLYVDKLFQIKMYLLVVKSFEWFWLLLSFCLELFFCSSY